MTIFDRLFQKENNEPVPTDIKFGRYSDAYKEAEQYDLWDRALVLFDEQKYLDAYEYFLQYLNDPTEENVRYSRSESSLSFEVIQGSKRLIGKVEGNELRVTSKVAKINQPNEALYRHLMEYNYRLQYCRFGLTDDDHISILFDTSTIDGSPYKLYYALKEAANFADKEDDLLYHYYRNVEHTDQDLFHHLTDEKKQIKYDFLIQEIKTTLNLIERESVASDGYAGGVAYTLLNLAYRLDYLIKPEGYLMDRLEEINSIYFNNNISDIGQKIEMIKKEYHSILSHDKQLLKSEMYWVKSTFGITVPVNHDRIASFIDGELGNMDWYIEHEQDAIARSIPEYIIGYALFHYAPPKPDLDLLELYFRIANELYFVQLGFQRRFRSEDGKYQRRAIKKAIHGIVNDNDERYPLLNAEVGLLNYSSSAEFARSYLLMIQRLDMTRKE